VQLKRFSFRFKKQNKRENSKTDKKIKQPARDQQDQKSKEGDKKKNGFATIGFLAIVVGFASASPSL